MQQFDQEKLDVCQRSIRFVRWGREKLSKLKGVNLHARDQILRSSQSIPLNNAEGNAKRRGPKRRRVFEIARGSAFESAATLDVLMVTHAMTPTDGRAGKEMLLPIVRMLIRLARPNG